MTAIRTNGRSALWDGHVPPPRVTLATEGWGAVFQEVEYGTLGGTWDKESDQLHIAQLVTPAEHFWGTGRSYYRRVAPSAAVKAPGQRAVGGWRGPMHGRHLFLSAAQFEALVGVELRPDRLPQFTFALQSDPPRDDRVIEHMLNALAADLREGSPSGPLFAQMTIAAVLHRLVGLHGLRGGLRSQHLPDAKIDRVLQKIHADLSANLTLPELAAEIGVSVQYLCRAFRKVTGVSPHQYVVRERVRLARELIVHTRLSLSQVALKAGFSGQSQMSTCFRRVLNISPSSLLRQ